MLLIQTFLIRVNQFYQCYPWYGLGFSRIVYSHLRELYISPMPAYLDWVRAFCLSLPHATEGVQWEHDLLFRIAGKMFCVANLEPGMSPTKIAFKCIPEKFAELVEIDGIIPAPYMARNHWVAMLDMDALRQPEIKELITESYQIILAKLPKKTQAELGSKPPAKTTKAKPRRSKPPAKAAKAKPSRAKRSGRTAKANRS
jgi:predicted DNA-binding protein (MmcQ/YjbR family)